MVMPAVDKARSSTKRRPLLLGGLVVLVAALGATVLWPDGAPPARAGGASASVADAHQAAPGHSASVGLPASPRGASEVANPAATAMFQADTLYRQALRYVDCRRLADEDESRAQNPAGAGSKAGLPGVDAGRIEREDPARHQACLGVGPFQYVQIDSLMRQASQLGHRDARFFLLNENVQAEVERAVEALQQGRPLPDGASDATLADVRTMALQGDREAMTLTGQLLASGLLAPPDPVRAAAWNLVELQLERGRPLSEDDLGNSGVLSSLSDEQARQALEQAATLRVVCCQSR